jgi:hypothetical protein
MPSVISRAPTDSQWTVRVHGQSTNETPPLVVYGRDLMPLVAQLLGDARVQDIVVRPRIREVRAHVADPASAPRER